MSTINAELGGSAWSPPQPGTAGRARHVLGVGSVAFTIAADALVIAGSFALAYVLRFVVQDDLGPAQSGAEYAGMEATVAVVVVALLASHGMYDLDHPRQRSSQLYAILSSVSIALVLAVTLAFFIGETSYSRVWFAAGWGLTITTLAVWRAALERAYAALRVRFVPARRAIVVGANAAGRESACELEASGYEVVGYVDNGSDLGDQADHPLLGAIADLEELVQSCGVEELLIALPFDRREQLSRILTRGFRRPVQIKYALDMADLLPRRFAVRRIGTRQYVDFAPVARVSWLKRAADLAAGVPTLLALLPLFVVVAIAIKLDSRGPIFYTQTRVGKDVRPFRMLKFRSMQVNADELLLTLLDRNEVSGPIFKIRRDPRVTRVGRVLRRFSLDELPQLINVVLGDMSLVGPRPPTSAEVERYEDWQIGRLRARPGITGLWQVSGRTEVPFLDMVRLDLHYIRNWSLGLDAEILLRTIPAVLSTKGAY
jgi:exopolysaccharide biosynthesis polyprenyl glycosylphosphotransferase